MTKVLYRSGDVHEAIQHLLRSRESGDRVVIIAAYVGAASAAYIPSPRGVHIVCNPTPGATSGKALRELLRRGARVEVSDKLHMKVYWSSTRGCVITSANLTSNALARKGLREAGVLFPPGKVDIDRLLKQASPRRLTARDLHMLDKGRPRQDAVKGAVSIDSTIDFRAWHASPHRQPWKLGIWSDNSFANAKAAIDRVRREYDLREPADSINAAKGQLKRGDWVLCFEERGRSLADFSWLYVDFVVPVDRSETKAYEADYPFQAVQVHPLRLCPEPPFTVTTAFRGAFQKAVNRRKEDWLWNLASLLPTKPLLDEVAHDMAAAASTIS